MWSLLGSKTCGPDCLPVPMDGGWNASGEPPPPPPSISCTHQSSWQPCAVTSSPKKPRVFHSDIKVTSVYLHDTRYGSCKVVREGQSGWVLQAVISRASSRRPRNGKSFFTMMSLHINNHYAKKRGIGKKLILTIRTVMLHEHVDKVADDFNGAAWAPPVRQ